MWSSTWDGIWSRGAGLCIGIVKFYAVMILLVPSHSPILSDLVPYSCVTWSLGSLQLRGMVSKVSPLASKADVNLGYICVSWPWGPVLSYKHAAGPYEARRDTG